MYIFAYTFNVHYLIIGDTKLGDRYEYFNIRGFQNMGTNIKNH